jgi:hypothetical protein
VKGRKNVMVRSRRNLDLGRIGVRVKQRKEAKEKDSR